MVVVPSSTYGVCNGDILVKVAFYRCLQEFCSFEAKKHYLHYKYDSLKVNSSYMTRSRLEVALEVSVIGYVGRSVMVRRCIHVCHNP